MSNPYNTFSYYTFGCKVNFADSSFIARELIDNGFTKVNIENYPDLCLINTCSVTDNADKKARSLIRKINRISPQSKIIVFGCYAQLNPDQIKKINGVFKVIGMEDKFNIKSLLKDINSKIVYNSNIKSVNSFNITYSQSERVRSFLKIQDGCDYNCSYCTIPLARGKSRSMNVDNTIDVIKDIVQKDCKEIVLSGINIGDFGISYKQKFKDLLLELENIDDLKRYRISSIEPNLINEDMIKIISNSKKAMPHFHIPLQSGSNKILRLMRRRYTKEEYYNVIRMVKKYIPNVCIGVDVIVGFPSESDNDFNETYEFLNSLDVSYLHVFSYSERKNTDAVEIFPKVSKVDKASRREQLMQLSNRKNIFFKEGNLGVPLSTLFESYEEGYLSGLTENYIRVKVKGPKLFLNQIKDVVINSKDSIYNGVLID
tara:strand:+ start:359 stop:1645 length:1287 start_codon:yes stop_codon:yes gene_type:complete